MKKFLRFIVMLLAVSVIPMVADAQVGSDVNGDGEVSIADINAVIDAILDGAVTSSADVNGDGEVTLADVNAVVNSIVGGSDPTPPGPSNFGGIKEETLVQLRECGMNLYSGDTPPNVEGVYAIDPVSYLANFGWDDFEDTDEIMTKIIVDFQDQAGDQVLFNVGAYYRDVDSGYEYFDTDNEQVQVSISGYGNKFTAAYCLMIDNPSGFFDFIKGSGMVMSGEMTETGIRNAQFAYVIYLKNNDGSIASIFVVYGDEDGMSYPTVWPDVDDDWSPAVGSAPVKSLMATKMPKLARLFMKRQMSNK